MFGRQVADYRRRRGMTQDDLAAATGLSVRSLRDVENGRVARPRPTTVRLLADAFGLAAQEYADFAGLAAGMDAAPVPAPVVPAELPALSGHFTGRDRETARLSEVVREARLAGSMPFAAVVGPAGVGKTSFVVHWAHRMRAEFPDGQIFADLRGFSAEPPLPPVTALRRLLWSLGVPAGRIPYDAEEAAALYRSVLSDQRVLIVLDNVLSAQQVRPLLPGGPGNAVVVTSRDRLPELTARHGAHRMALDALTEEEARRLIRRIVGGNRLAAEPDAVHDLAVRCGRLPLALCLAAANLADNPDQTVSAYLARYRTGSWLYALGIPGDRGRTVQSTFDLSLRMLTERQQRLLDLLGLVPGPDFTSAAAAALTGGDPAAAEEELIRLAGAHLIQRIAPDRFAFHDLIREYARDRVAARPTAETAAAVTGLYRYYRDVSACADRILHPGALRLPGPATEVPAAALPAAGGIGDERAARDWFADETANLVAACLRAGSSDLTGQRTAAIRLADSLGGHLWTCRDLATWSAVARCALEAARAEGDFAGQAAAEIALAKIDNCRCAYPAAMSHLNRALQLSGRAGWRSAEGETLGSLAALQAETGDARIALGHWQSALAISRQTGTRLQQGRTLLQIGTHHSEQGQLTAAAETLETALKLVDAESSRIGRAIVLNNLAEVCLLRRDFDGAGIHADEVLLLCTELGHVYGAVFARLVLSAVHRGRRCAPEALAEAIPALRTAATLGDAHALGHAHHEVAAAYDAGGDRGRGIAHHRAAYQLSAGIQSRFLDIRHSIALALAEHRLTPEVADARPGKPDLKSALRRAQENGYLGLEGAALAALAEVRRDAGDGPGAGRLARRALAMQDEAGWRTDRVLLQSIIDSARTCG